jgi:hypothetical protein
MLTEKYQLPKFLTDEIRPEDYRKWLDRKALAHVQRDRDRGNTAANKEKYKIAIHEAIKRCEGKDDYTGRDLDWSLVGQYDNESSASNGRAYRLTFRYLPTVDHVGDGMGAPDFKICGLQTNDSKSCLTHEEFVAFCREVIAHKEKLKP